MECPLAAPRPIINGTLILFIWSIEPVNAHGNILVPPQTLMSLVLHETNIVASEGAHHEMLRINSNDRVICTIVAIDSGLLVALQER